MASSISQLDWMQDGIDGTESEAIQSMLYIAVTSRSVVSSLLSLGWVRDGISADEAEAIDWINNMSGAEVMSSVVALGWVQDGIDDGLEVGTIEELSYIVNDDTGLGLAVVALGWVQDGIDDIEARAIDWINNIRGAQVMSAVVALGWVQDGIDDLEVKTIERLSYIGYEDTELGLSVVSLGWVRDGIEELEAKAIEELSYIAHEDAEAASRIVVMPFVETIEPPDVSAMASLSRLAAFEPKTFDRVMSHAALRDGISDDLAPIVATLRGVAETNPGLIDVLLHPAKVTVEQRTIRLPLAGDVVLAIIRTGSGAARSMDLLEHAVRGVERSMGLPLPTNYVGLLYENAVSGSSAGTNFGTHVAILPEYDVDDGSREAEVAGSHIAHEVAHYYWSGNADWVDEGAADLMVSIVEWRADRQAGRRLPTVPAPTRPLSPTWRVSARPKSDIEFECNYALGERLFVDLYRTLGDEQFLQGFRALYLASEMEDDEDDSGTSVSIGHVGQAFRSDDGAERAVIARWYDGAEPYDRSKLDYSPVDPRLPSISGRIDKAYIVTESDGPAVGVFSARDVSGWVLLTLEHSYSVSAIRDVQLEIVEYFEDGFAFHRRTINLTAEPQYIGGTNWFSVGSPPSRKWAAGRYFAYVYVDERKVAEVEYEVIP